MGTARPVRQAFRSLIGFVTSFSGIIPPGHSTAGVADDVLGIIRKDAIRYGQMGCFSFPAVATSGQQED